MRRRNIWRPIWPRTGRRAWSTRSTRCKTRRRPAPADHAPPGPEPVRSGPAKGGTLNRSITRTGRWLYRRAENILAVLQAAMFVAFILQIIFRYLLNFPVGWTNEISVVLWIWLLLWGAAFVLRDEEEIRFDLL